MYYVYILISVDGRRTYTGCTCDINRRLKEHNSGKVRYSKSFASYNILHLEEFNLRKDALRSEKFYKSTSGRRKIKEFLADKGESASFAKKQRFSAKRARLLQKFSKQLI